MPVPQSRPSDVAARLAAGEEGLVLLDCREPEELQIASIDGVQHIPMNEIPGSLERLDPDRTYVVVCHHGNRSDMVSRFLEARGFPQVENLAGGIDLWSREVDSSIPLY